MFVADLKLIFVYHNCNMCRVCLALRFALSDKAHWSLRERNEEQCVVVSGESGSGKTEAARIVLQYVTVAGSGPHLAHKNPTVCPTKQVRDRLLQAGPLLEGINLFYGSIYLFLRSILQLLEMQRLKKMTILLDL